MSTFNSLSHARQLEAAGVPRTQAEVHAQLLQSLYDEEHKQYATKTDFVMLSNDMKSQLKQVEAKTDHLEEKLTQVEVKLDQVEVKLSADISAIKTSMVECKNEFANFRTEMSALRTSHKYILWINGGMATVCLTALGLCIPLVLHTLK